MGRFLTNAEIGAIKTLAKFADICKCDCKDCEFSKDIGNSTCIPILAQRWVAYGVVAGRL